MATAVALLVTLVLGFIGGCAFERWAAGNASRPDFFDQNGEG